MPNLISSLIVFVGRGRRLPVAPFSQSSQACAVPVARSSAAILVRSSLVAAHTAPHPARHVLQSPGISSTRFGRRRAPASAERATAMRYIAAFWRGGLVVGHTVVSMLTDGLESRSHSFRIPFARALVSPQPEWPRQRSLYAFSITFSQF